MIDTHNRFLTAARELAPRFCERAAHWDQTRTYCWPNVADLAQAGLAGMMIPKEYGGGGAGLLETVEVIEEVAKACALTARIVVEANMGALSALLAYGTPEQKAHFAPLVLAGDKPAVCITEPAAGSGATHMTSTARRVEGGYLLNGRKCWITGGGVSKTYLVFAGVVDDDGREEGIGGFLMHEDPDTGISNRGFSVARLERTMGLCGMPEAELVFDDVMIPADFALEPPSGLAQGFADLMSAYNCQRVGAGTVALGIAAGALDRAKEYAQSRQQFGRPIAEFQGIQWMLAEMDAEVHAARLMLHEAARSAEGTAFGFPDLMMAARAKFFSTEVAIRVVDTALQIFGARGYGSEEPLERMYRDVRMFTIGGGTAQILKTQVAGQLLGMRTPQTRDGYSRLAAEGRLFRTASAR